MTLALEDVAYDAPAGDRAVNAEARVHPEPRVHPDLDLLRAGRLEAALGIGDADRFWVHGYNVETRRTGWTYREEHPGRWWLARGLTGRFGLSVGGLRTTRVLVVDLDCHDLRLRSGKRADLGEVLDPVTNRARARAGSLRMRKAIARRLRPAVRAVLEASPGCTWSIESSPRGLHLVLLLDRPHDVVEVHAAGVALLARAGVVGEVFPTREGRLCRAPLTGTGRLLGPDLSAPAFRTRSEDRDQLLSAPRSALSAVGHSPGSPPPPSYAPSESELAGITRAAGGECRVDLHEVEQLRGGDFAGWVVETARCIPARTSWTFAAKFAALAVYADVDDEEAVTLFRRLIERPGHAASSCRTQAGRRSLLSKFRAQLRHQRRGVEAGNVKPGMLRNRAALGLLAALRRDAELPAVAPGRADRSWSETIAARRAARAKAWATRRATPGHASTTCAGEDHRADQLEREVARLEHEAERIGAASPRPRSLDAAIMALVLVDLARTRGRMLRSRKIGSGGDRR